MVTKKHRINFTLFKWHQESHLPILISTKTEACDSGQEIRDWYLNFQNRFQLCRKILFSSENLNIDWVKWAGKTTFMP